MSEVHAHFVDPFFRIIRAVNLAKEALVIDGPALPSANYEIDLGAGIDPATTPKTTNPRPTAEALLGALG
jgi:hypothetical protein